MSRQPNYLIQSIGSVYTDRSKYANYPPCQREKVWQPPIRQKLVDSILRSLHVPAIVVLRQETLFGRQYEVVDGQQRLETIIDFIENKFKTMRYPDEPGMPLIEPDRYFREMVPEKQAAFLDYPLQMCVLEGNDHSIGTVGLMYRRLQYQMKLTGAEKLFSYTSSSREAAIVVARHTLWDDLYEGKTIRKQPFQMGIIIILLEVQGGFANLTTPRLKDTASGLKDSDVGDELAKTIQQRLDGMKHVLAGATISGMNEIIPIYQAAIFLEEAGYDLRRSERGCIAAWFMDYKQRALEAQRRLGYRGGFAILTKVNEQAKFWAEQRNSLFACAGLLRRDPRRQFDRLERVTVWNRQRGICPVCKKTVKIQDIGHHVLFHSEGGTTTVDNGRLVHYDCHVALHRSESTRLQ